METLALETTPDQLKLSTDGRIDEDIFCLTCGYNLRTLFPDTDCPECGTDISLSIRGDFLRFSNPKWVKIISRGMNFIWGAVVTILLTFLGMLFIGVVAAMSVGSGNTGKSLAIIPMLAGLAFLAALAMLLLGSWYITSPDEGHISEQKHVNARRLTRYVTLTCVAIIVLDMGLTRYLITTPELILAMTIIRFVCQIVLYFAFFTHMRNLALRVPDTKLAGHTRIVMWGYVVVVVLAIITAIINAIAVANATPVGGGVTPAPGVTGMVGFDCVFTIAAFVFGIWSLILVDKYKKVLKLAAVQAKESWDELMDTPDSDGNPVFDAND